MRLLHDDDQLWSALFSYVIIRLVIDCLLLFHTKVCSKHFKPQCHTEGLSIFYFPCRIVLFFYFSLCARSLVILLFFYYFPFFVSRFFSLLLYCIELYSLHLIINFFKIYLSTVIIYWVNNSFMQIATLEKYGSISP